MIGAALKHLDNAKPYLPAVDSAELTGYFDRGTLMIDVHDAAEQAVASAVRFNNLMKNPKALPGRERPASGERSGEAAALRRLADQAESRYGSDIPIGNPSSIRAFCSKVESNLNLRRLRYHPMDQASTVAWQKDVRNKLFKMMKMDDLIANARAFRSTPEKQGHAKWAPTQ